MDLGLDNKTALILGAGGGLGYAIARAFAAEGANLAIADIDTVALARTRDELHNLGARLLPLPWDISDLSTIAENISTIESHFGQVDILVNLTGGPPPTTARDHDTDLWKTCFQSMVLSVIAITEHVLPSMVKRRWGRIVTSASSGVVIPIPNLAISNALRLSLLGWSKTLAREVAHDGITANIIVPGRVATDRIRYLDETKAKREGRSLLEIVAESTSSIPIGRYGRPEEYASVVAFLASEHASYITGSVIRVDGGMIASI